MTAADNASASIKWYYVTDSGDLEIAEAGNSLSYTPTDAPFDIKVVATGTGDSEGSSAELIFKKPQQASSTITVSTWNPDTRQAIIKWDAIEGAATYTLKFSKMEERLGQTIRKDFRTTIRASTESTRVEAIASASTESIAPALRCRATRKEHLRQSQSIQRRQNTPLIRQLRST